MINTIMKYEVAFHKSEEGFSIWVPELPGCVSQGATEEEARSNIADAIREYLIIADERAAQDDLVRLVDESGEDYLYNRSYFTFVDFPHD